MLLKVLTRVAITIYEDGDDFLYFQQRTPVKLWSSASNLGF